MTNYTTADFKRWGAQGPKKRKCTRTLTHKQSKAMLKLREQNRMILPNGARISRLLYFTYRNRAIAVVTQEIYKGRLTRLTKANVPCKDCVSKATEYDHRNYAEPLIVEAVCHKCNVHRGNGNVIITCAKCGHLWTPKMKIPVQCAKCRSPYWNKKRQPKPRPSPGTMKEK